MAARMIGMGLLALLVGACGQSEPDDLQQWMQTINAQVVPRAQPLEKTEPFSAEAYIPVAELEPFDALRLPQWARQTDSGTPPEVRQARADALHEPASLETAPISAVVLVGSLTRGVQKVAIVKVGNTFYQVQLGSRLGLGGSRVIQILETEIKLRGKVQNDRGAWVERLTTLPLQKK